MSLEKLMEWIDEQEIVIDKRITIRKFNGMNIGVLSNATIPKNTVIAKIPKLACLSPKQTAIADLIEEQHYKGLLALTIALMYEYTQGEKSPYYGYLYSLPEYEETLLFWSDKELECLKGTCVYKDLPIYKQLLLDDFNNEVYPFISQHTPFAFPDSYEKSYYAELYYKCTTLITSRAFEIDKYHGDSMIPVADLFNHSNNEDVHMENIADVCELCGELWCPCQLADQDENGEYKDYMDNLTSQELNEIHEGNDYGDDEQEDEDDEADRFLEMRLVKSVKKNTQIFNTFGQHPNSVLLTRYGFCLENNLNDMVNFSIDEFVSFIINETEFGKSSDEQLILNRILLWKRCQSVIHSTAEEQIGEFLEKNGYNKGQDGDEWESVDGEEEDFEDINEEELEEEDDDDEDPEEEEAEFSEMLINRTGLTIDCTGKWDIDLITICAFILAPKETLYSVQSDPSFASEWVRNMLKASSKDYKEARGLVSQFAAFRLSQLPTEIAAIGDNIKTKYADMIVSREKSIWKKVNACK